MERITLSKDQKLCFYAVLIAFFLSFLLGLVSGKPAAMALVRAIISSILFGALLFAGLYLLRRYIPEWKTEGKEGDDAATVGVQEEAGSEALGTRVDYRVADQGGSGGMLEQMAAASAENAAEHPKGEQTSGGSPSPERIQMKQRSTNSPEEGDELGTEQAGDEDGASEGELPSLDSLFDDSEQDAVPDVESTIKLKADSNPSTSGFIKVGDATIPNEPEMLAKAVKKVMNQDE
jgi:hypothetical protein